MKENEQSRIEEIIDRFPTDVRNKMLTSQLLKNCVYAIANGASVYSILYQVIESNDNVINEFKEYIIGDTRPQQYIITTKDEIDKIRQRIDN